MSRGIDRYWTSIRSAALEILSDQEFDFRHRLLMLGVYCDNITILYNNGDYSGLTEFMDGFAFEMSNNDELRDYRSFPQDTAFQFRFLNDYLMRKIKETIWNVRYRECLVEYTQGITRYGDSIQDISRSYEEAYALYLSPFEEKNPHFFPNIVINRIFGRMLSDLDRDIPLFDSYALFVLEYAMLKLHLIGISAFHRNMNMETAVKVVQSYYKNYEHSVLFHKGLLDELKKEGYEGLGYLSLLIKNGTAAAD